MFFFFLFSTPPSHSPLVLFFATYCALQAKTASLVATETYCEFGAFAYTFDDASLNCYFEVESISKQDTRARSPPQPMSRQGTDIVRGVAGGGGGGGGGGVDKVCHMSTTLNMIVYVLYTWR